MLVDWLLLIVSRLLAMNLLSGGFNIGLILISNVLDWVILFRKGNSWISNR